MGLGSIPRALMNGRFAGVLGILSFLALRFWDPAPLEIARHKVFDLYQTAHPRVVAEYPVTIVDIDERSLATLGQWPWSRSVVAELVDRLAANGAASIGFDVLFSEPDRLSPRRIARDLNLFDPAAAAKLQELPDSDELFSQSIRGAPVVLGQAGQRGEPVKREGADEQPHTSIATIGGDPRGQLIRFQSLLRNLPEFEVAAMGRGLVSIQPERDGIIRRVPTVLTSEDLIVPALSIELLRVARGSNSLVVKSDEAGVRSLVVGGVEIATDRDAQVWPHFSPHDPKRSCRPPTF
jgi:adenylate cyclase